MTVIDVFYFVTIQPITVKFGKSQIHETARYVEVSGQIRESIFHKNGIK